MIGAPNPDDPQLKAASVPPDDPIFDFSITDWLDPPNFVTTLPATTKESNIRLMTEQEYRDSTTPTAWNRYLTLGRYATDGFTFDTIMTDILIDPRKAHCLIWFQYSYHLDHKITIPAKLQAWYSRRSQPFLSTNQLSVFNLDTTKTTWKEFSRSQSLSNPWSEVLAKQKRQKNKKVTLTTGYATAASILGNRSKPSTITEEPSSKASSDTFSGSRGTKRFSSNDAKSTASDGKQSVLEQSLNVPVCDGTHRVTLRWKTKLDLFKTSQTQALKEEIYKLLNDIFDDTDGLLYPWQQEGRDTPDSISKMSPTKVRQYISPSLSILPSQSTIIIPLRFGFSSSSPANWRNLQSTRSKLEHHDATVSFSNCTSTSGDLTIAGYILLKAPMTTHRLRYLQSIRQTLPSTTPPFDILLHKRTPLDQQIPHLAVQCGNKTVHSLSETLANTLTGNGSALYIPRFALSHMSESESLALFSTHDMHVKSLRWLLLNPLLSNLDKPRKEYNADGTIIERTTRAWARTITNIEGTDLAQCDVVNGGSDQLSYLLFLPQHTEAATLALDIYRRRLYPYTQREEKFRDSVGPPLSIHMSRSVIANLDFIKRLSTSSQHSDTATNDSDHKDSTSTVTPDSEMTDHSPQPAPRPPTPAESLRARYKQALASDTFASASATSDDDDELTSATTATDESKLSAGRMSTSSAKIRELDAVIQRQHKTIAKKDAKSSERISSIERQLHRINDLDAKLDEAKTDFGTRLNLFEARMVESMTSTMNNNMQQLMAVVTKMASPDPVSCDKTTLSITEVPETADPSMILRNELLYTAQESSSSSDSTLASNSSNLNSTSSSNSSMSAESSSKIQSPEHKRLRSKKKLLKSSIRRHLDSAMEAAGTPPSTAQISTQSTIDSLDHAMQQVDKILKIDFSSTDVHSDPEATPDPESQYTADTNSYEDSKRTASPSPGRGSQT